MSPSRARLVEIKFFICQLMNKEIVVVPKILRERLKSSRARNSLLALLIEEILIY